MVVRLVGSGEEADQVVGVVGDQVLTATSADVGKVVTVASDGTLTLAAGGGGGVSDHGALTGLADDDHPYLLESAVSAFGLTLLDDADAAAARATLGAARALRLAPAYDSYIYAQFSSTNFASATVLKLGDSWNAATFASFPVLRFSLADVGATIASAVLYLTVDPAFSGNALDLDNLNVQVRKLLQPYHDTQMTWNVYSTGNAWGSVGARLNGTDRSTAIFGSDQIGRLVAGSKVAIDITGLVQVEKDASASTLSIILGTTQVTNAQNAVDFASNDHATASARPVLAVVSQ